MQQSILKKAETSILPLLLLLFFLGGCSSTAKMQGVNKEKTSNNKQAPRAKKTSDLSGLWLLPQIDGPVHDQLQSEGVALSQKEMYDPDSASLSQAIAKIKSGDTQAGTGSFVSPNGLLLTDYSSALDGVAQNSSINNNLIHNGFAAESQGQEIPLQDYSLLITLEQQEVTQQINSQLADTLTYRERKRQSQQIKQQLIAKRKEGRKNLAVEINDVWAGNRQFMSVYKIIRDLRLVHVPSNPNLKKSSNYAFLRAYVNPNGQSETYNKSNVPYQPQTHLSIAENKPVPQDVTLTLGFPGETQRYESSYAVTFYKNNRNPVLIDTYKAILDAAEYTAQKDSAAAIANAPLRSSLSHNLRYYRALQEGIGKHNIIAKKQGEEEQFEKWIKQDSLRNITYHRVQNQIDQAYRIASQTGNLLFALVNTINNNKILQIAALYNSYYSHISDSSNTEINSTKQQELLQRHQSILSEINVEAQTKMLEKMLYTLATLPDGKVPFHLIELFGDKQGDALKKEIASYLEQQRSQSIVYNVNRAKEFLSLPADSVQNQPKGTLVTLYEELLNSYQFSRKNYSQHVPYLEPAQQLYVQGLLRFRNDSITYPDANGTLRLSIGHIKKPQTQEQNKPTTKTIDSKTKMVHFVSTNDITGGSMGSPTLNSSGKLMGIVTKRTPESMVNDLLFKPELSHTIQVDIRHIISEIKEFYDSPSLLEEMGKLDSKTE